MSEHYFVKKLICEHLARICEGISFEMLKVKNIHSEVTVSCA